jgi:hypothetical protein
LIATYQREIETLLAAIDTIADANMPLDPEQVMGRGTVDDIYKAEAEHVDDNENDTVLVSRQLSNNAPVTMVERIVDMLGEGPMKSRDIIYKLDVGYSKEAKQRVYATLSTMKKRYRITQDNNLFYHLSKGE